MFTTLCHCLEWTGGGHSEHSLLKIEGKKAMANGCIQHKSFDPKFQSSRVVSHLKI